jgi:hypothetical protein
VVVARKALETHLSLAGQQPLFSVEFHSTASRDGLNIAAKKKYFYGLLKLRC